MIPKARLISEARMRHVVHLGQNSSRPLSSDYELIGLVGEVQAEQDFGLKRNNRILRNGDGRSDCILPNGYTVDWKVARKAFNLIIEVGKSYADINVLGQYREDADHCWVEWRGWEYGFYMALQPSRDFGYGVINHFMRAEKLRSMTEFIALLKGARG
jgi:hypothetical protein